MREFWENLSEGNAFSDENDQVIGIMQAQQLETASVSLLPISSAEILVCDDPTLLEDPNTSVK